MSILHVFILHPLPIGKMRKLTDKLSREDFIFETKKNGDMIATCVATKLIYTLPKGQFIIEEDAN